MDSQRFWLDIAIPTRTRAYALRQNIPNILSQAEKTGAAISFYDNASTDDTEDYLTDLAARHSCVHYQRNNENIGLDRNMLLGVKYARADYVFWLGDDDSLRTDALASIQSLLQEQKPDLLLLSMIHSPAEWDRTPQRQITYTDPVAFFSECCYYLPFGTQVFKADMAREQLNQSDRFVGTYHAYSGLLFDALAQQHLKQRNCKVLWHKEPLVKCTGIPKAWATDKAAVYLVGLPTWFDNLHPAYGSVKVAMREKFTHWPDYLDLLQTVTTATCPPDVLIAHLQAQLASIRTELADIHQQLADTRRLSDERLHSIMKRWTWSWFGWHLMPWTKPDWLRHL